MSSLQSINPYNGKLIAGYEKHNSEAVKASIRDAHKAFLNWKGTEIDTRALFIRRVASILRANVNTYAKTVTEEVGKPIVQARAEIEKCAWVCEYYADTASQHLAPKTIVTDADESYVTYEPLGPVLAVMPWNYPFWQVFRFAAPALMAGNVGLLKHASNVSGCALHIESIFRDAGLEDGCFTTLLIGSDMVEDVISNPLVKAVTLTGSGPAGSAVAGISGRYIKKSVMELGGNNAFIVLPDADIDHAVDICVNARFQNTGQSCIAAKRLLLHQDIKNEFTDKLVYKISSLISGDPAAESTYIGTLARPDLAAELEDQLNSSVKMGAKVLIGGKRNSAYFSPSLVTDVTPEMPIFKEETFGPLLAITSFKDFDEAISLSNNSRYGLGVSIFTSDTDIVKKRVADFEEGAVFINELVKSDPRLPFGGIKESGYGRELSADGIIEFVNRKTVYIKR